MIVNVDKDASQSGSGAVFVSVCTGHRCGALLQGSAGEGLAVLRQAVRSSARTVLVSTGCLGGCAVGPLMAVSRGTCIDGRVHAVDTCWLGPMQARSTSVLARWLVEGGPSTGPVPPELRAVRLVAGPGPHGAD